MYASGMMLDAIRKALDHDGDVPNSRARAALTEVVAAELVIEAAERIIRNNAYPDELATALGRLDRARARALLDDTEGQA